MRDYSDAKAMARRLREALAERGAQFGHSDCLELVARSFGVKDWHVLSALIAGADQPEAKGPPPAAPRWSGPALLLRGIVVFPRLKTPLFIGRAASVRAQQSAYEGELEVLLVTQKDRSDENPGADGVYGMGVIADVLERIMLPDGSLKLMVRGRHRARLTALRDESGYWRAEAEPLPSLAAPLPGDEALIATAVQAFETYAASARVDEATRAWAGGLTHIGMLADLIAAHARGEAEAKQAILETLDPRKRLAAALSLFSEPRAKPDQPSAWLLRTIAAPRWP
jgi:ATP-dependent Lon protease